MSSAADLDPYMSTPVIIKPEHVVTQEETLELLEGLLPEGCPKREKFRQIVHHTRVAKRHLIRPLKETLKNTGLAERQAAFEREGPKLALEVGKAALDDVQARPEDIGMVMAVCATAPANMMPGLDQVIISKLGLKTNTVGLPVAQWGCRGGGAALGLARTYCLANPEKAVLIVMVETCSLLYQPADMKTEEFLQPAVICNALFGDASGACVVAGAMSPLLQNPWAHGVRMKLGESGTHQLPESLRYMNYDTSDNGMHFRLTPQVPLAMSSVAPVVMKFVEDHGIPIKDLPNCSFLLHTGGPKVLHHFMQVVAKIEDVGEIEDGSLDPRVTHALETLTNLGNVASVSLLSTVRGRMLDGLEEGQDFHQCLLAGCGPGMGADWLLCSMHPDPVVSAQSEVMASKSVSSTADIKAVEALKLKQAQQAQQTLPAEMC